MGGKFNFSVARRLIKGLNRPAGRPCRRSGRRPPPAPTRSPPWGGGRRGRRRGGCRGRRPPPWPRSGSCARARGTSPGRPP
eukprot:9202327-Pyramimonas_sp.AAC.1